MTPSLSSVSGATRSRPDRFQLDALPDRGLPRLPADSGSETFASRSSNKVAAFFGRFARPLVDRMGGALDLLPIGVLRDVGASTARQTWSVHARKPEGVLRQPWRPVDDDADRGKVPGRIPGGTAPWRAGCVRYRRPRTVRARPGSADLSLAVHAIRVEPVEGRAGSPRGPAYSSCVPASRWRAGVNRGSPGRGGRRCPCRRRRRRASVPGNAGAVTADDAAGASHFTLRAATQPLDPRRGTSLARRGVLQHAANILLAAGRTPKAVLASACGSRSTTSVGIPAANAADAIPCHRGLSYAAFKAANADYLHLKNQYLRPFPGRGPAGSCVPLSHEYPLRHPPTHHMSPVQSGTCLCRCRDCPTVRPPVPSRSFGRAPGQSGYRRDLARL